MKLHFFQLEGQSNSSNHETIDAIVTCQSDCNMEQPVDVTTNTSKNLKPAAESIIPANLNTTNGDGLARKLFGTPDSKELLMQAHLKVTLVVVTIPNNILGIIICDNKKGTYMLIDVAVPGERNVIKNEAEKI